MKSFFTYILLISFAFRPMYTLGYIGYFELNIDYIIKIYCVNKDKPVLKCNGKCHLATQLDLPSNSSEETTPLIAEAFFPVYFETVELSVEGETLLLQEKKPVFGYIIPKYTNPDFRFVPPPKLS